MPSNGVQQRLGAPVLGLRTCAPRASPHFALSQFLQYNKFRKVLKKTWFVNLRENFKNAKTAPIAAANAKRRLAAPLYERWRQKFIVLKRF